MAFEFGPYIHVNCIAPGFIGTENELDGYDEEFLKEEQEKIEDDKYTTISKIINQLCETVYYNCILTENFIDTIVNRRNRDI